MKLADIKRGEKHRPPPCEPFLHETLFRPLFHRGFGQRAYRGGFDFVPSVLFLFFIFRHQLEGKTTTFGEHWGIYYTEVRPESTKASGKKVQILVQHTGAKLVQHLCSVLQHSSHQLKTGTEVH